ncbi:MAG: SOS response-associated peptidase [Aphanothece sp. CMT-3BRIN-NPC111]|jgi:putative SOS response-associated peptidase YedK|nr:SOS response-associated peptidase [Aphanothece sp. CMT-3BRIN-NPC111]
MCGRFSQSQSAEIIAKAFEVDNVPSLSPRYNIAPTQPVGTILQTGEQRKRQFQMLHWGLIPSWAKDKKMGARMINARAETVAEKPAFRAAFKQRRCLVVADGFYEWKQQDGKKQPFYCRVNDGQPFGFAGLWEHWEGEDGEAIESCTILTTEPNEIMRPIHNRMPVILDPKDYDLWLDSKVKSELLQPLLRPYSAEEMAVYPVSTKVNKPVNDSSELINSL